MVVPMNVSLLDKETSKYTFLCGKYGKYLMYHMLNLPSHWY